MNQHHKSFTVMTLDAGGTNFVFSAIRDQVEIIEPVVQASFAHDLKLCLRNIIDGFEKVYSKINKKADAISFAFPGPADYRHGVIGDLGNLPAFRGGVALGPMLESHFCMPVLINNDGDLFAYGEAMFGFLPKINQMMDENSSQFRYQNLIGVTLGTGFGCGIIHGKQILQGDNNAAGEVWLMRDPVIASTFAEESISARAIIKSYLEHASYKNLLPTPKDVFEIAMERKNGDRKAAIKVFEKFGQALGDALATIATIIDANIVIGGGLSKAWELFQDAVVTQMNGHFMDGKGKKINRLVSTVYNLEKQEDRKIFFENTTTEISVPYTMKTAHYHSEKKIGVGLSRLGTSKAISLGAFAFAYNHLNN